MPAVAVVEGKNRADIEKDERKEDRCRLATLTPKKKHAKDAQSHGILNTKMGEQIAGSRETTKKPQQR